MPKRPMFIGDRQQNIAVVLTAERRVSRSRGQPYIHMRISFGEADEASCILGRIGYSHYVLQHGLPTDSASEDANIATLVGRSINVRTDFVQVDDRTYLRADYIA